MSDKDRRVKDGIGANKDSQRMREEKDLSFELPGDKSKTPMEAMERDSFDHDLRPNEMAGVNFGQDGPHPEKFARTAEDYKEFHERFPEFTNDELRQLPILPEGSRLEQGATYIDLNRIEQGEFTATSGMIAGRDGVFVPKSEVDYQLWNRLRGVRDAERIGA